MHAPPGFATRIAGLFVGRLDTSGHAVTKPAGTRQLITAHGWSSVSAFTQNLERRSGFCSQQTGKRGEPLDLESAEVLA